MSARVPSKLAALMYFLSVLLVVQAVVFEVSMQAAGSALPHKAANWLALL